MKPVILTVGSGVRNGTRLQVDLVKNGFDVIQVRDCDSALHFVEDQTVNLVLFDLMPPYHSNIEACRQLRADLAANCPPIVLLISRVSEFDRIKGLHVGADDFLVEPFETEELVARIHAILRRSEPLFEIEVLRLGGLEMNLTTHRTTLDGHAIKLRPAEFRILRFLMENPDRVFSRDQLIGNIWGNNIHIGARTVDVHIRRLRKALNRPGSVDHIRTVRAVGYALENPASEAHPRRSVRASESSEHELRGNV